MERSNGLQTIHEEDPIVVEPDVEATIV